MPKDYPGNSAFISSARARFTQRRLSYSIIEGTKESLERLQLDYVDIIFAHRHDPTGKEATFSMD